MALTTPRTWIYGETVTAAILNQQIRDNLNAIWTGTTAGDTEYYSNSTTKVRLPIGSTAQQLTVVSGVPTWRTNQVFFASNMTNTSYDGDAVVTGTTTITANTFNSNIPTTARAIMVSISAKWAAASDGNVANLRHADAGNGNGVLVRAQTTNFQDNNGIVGLNSSGQFKLIVSGANTTALYIDVWGYIL